MTDLPTLRVRDVLIGAPRLTVVVPLVAGDVAGLLRQADAAVSAGADVVEWRVDHWPRLDTAELPELGRRLVDRLQGAPLLATVRTTHEGGRADVDGDCYGRVVAAVAGVADLVDVEHRRRGAAELVGALRGSTPVVASFHDFAGTPVETELVEHLQQMQQIGAAVGKVAVTPRSSRDVLTLLSATEQAAHALHIPVVTVSMGQEGRVSRLAGHLFGSAATFASVGASSAPGQPSVGELRRAAALLVE